MHPSGDGPHVLGEAAAAQTLLRRAIELVGDDLLSKGSSANLDAVAGAVGGRALLASTLAHIGEFRRGAEYGAEALRIAEYFEHPYNVAYALLHFSWFYGLQGDPERALALGQRGVAICREWSIPFFS